MARYKNISSRVFGPHYFLHFPMFSLLQKYFHLRHTKRKKDFWTFLLVDLALFAIVYLLAANMVTFLANSQFTELSFDVCDIRKKKGLAQRHYGIKNSRFLQRALRNNQSCSLKMKLQIFPKIQMTIKFHS